MNWVENRFLMEKEIQAGVPALWQALAAEVVASVEEFTRLYVNSSGGHEHRKVTHQANKNTITLTRAQKTPKGYVGGVKNKTLVIKLVGDGADTKIAYSGNGEIGFGIGPSLTHKGNAIEPDQAAQIILEPYFFD